jgi:phosphatidylglycerophosphatase A
MKNSRIKQLVTSIATLGPVGYVPASGTFATVLTMLALLLLTYSGVPMTGLKYVVVPLVLLGMVIIHCATFFFEDDDPPEIVLDEVIGYIFALSLFPVTAYWAGAVAILFRFFDIVKPLGIKWVERIGGPSGILLDDLLAGFYTQIVLVLACMAYDVWMR